MKRSTIAAGSIPGHPFRRTLPARALHRLPEPEPEVVAAMARRSREAEEAEARLFAWDRSDASSPHEAMLICAGPPASGRRQLLTVQDVREFFLAYVACLIGALIFLS